MIARLTHCARAASRASAYLDGRLSPSARRRYQEHCRNCERCLATLRSQAALRRRVDALPRRLAPRGLAQQVVAEASRRRVRDLASLVDEPRRPPLARPRRIAVAGAAVVVVGLAFALGRGTAPTAASGPAPIARQATDAPEQRLPELERPPIATPTTAPDEPSPAVAAPTRLRPRRPAAADDPSAPHAPADAAVAPGYGPLPDLRPALEALPATHFGPPLTPPRPDPDPTGGPDTSRTTLRVEVHHREWSVRTR